MCCYILGRVMHNVLSSRKYPSPTTKGISRQDEIPPPQNFHFFKHKNNPQPFRIPLEYIHPPYPLEKITSTRKCLEVKVNIPHNWPSALQSTAVYSRSILTSEDTHKENIQQFI